MPRYSLRSTLTKRLEHKRNNTSMTSKPGHRHQLVVPRYSTRYSGGNSRERDHLGKHPSICRLPAHHYLPPTLHRTNRKPAKSRHCRRQGLHKQDTPTSRFPHTKELFAGKRPKRWPNGWASWYMTSHTPLSSSLSVEGVARECNWLTGLWACWIPSPHSKLFF